MMVVVLCCSILVLVFDSLGESFIFSCLVESWMGVSGFLILCVR